jgi:periplasmic divalent cation tolerance protein
MFVIGVGEMMETNYIILLVTTANKQEAENIAQSLLEARLIACANIISAVSSRFIWAEKIDHADEVLVLMKSRRDLFDEVYAKVKSLHSYEVPEVLALPIVAGSEAYLDWLGSSLKKTT